MTKGFISISAILGVLFVGTAGYFVVNQKNPKPTPIVSASSISTTTPALGQEFTLTKDNQTAKIAGTDLEIKAATFYNSTCPANAICLWSGIGIAFEYTFKGEIQKGINLFEAFGYQTKIISTDYKTYATLTVEKKPVALKRAAMTSVALSTCLPTGLKLFDIVSANIVATTNDQFVQKVTVEQTLSGMNAVCTNGKLLDATGKEIYFYHLTIGCGGAVPYNYQELLQKQRDEVNALKASYNVVEMTCNPSGIPRP